MLCFRKIPGAKFFMDKKGGIKIFRRKFFVSQTRRTLQGNPFVLCFRKIPVVNKFMDKRGGEYQDFPPNIFRLTVPKNDVGEPLVIQ